MVAGNSTYTIRFTREAGKDVKKLSPKLREKLTDIIVNRIALTPHSGKKLVGDLKGFYSVRLSLADRIVYSIDEQSRIIYVHRVRTHYGE